MTCVVGIAAGGRVVIGGDSAGVDERLALQVRADQKVFRRGAYAMGFTTSFRMGQLLRYAGDLPEPDSWDVDAFMATRFVGAARAIMRDGGYLTTLNGAESGGTFLVGWRDRLYTVFSDFQVARCVADFAAIGCGDQLALGALYAIGADGDPARAVQVALQAAATFSAGVRSPFHFVETDRSPPQPEWT